MTHDNWVVCDIPQCDLCLLLWARGCISTRASGREVGNGQRSGCGLVGLVGSVGFEPYQRVVARALSDLPGLSYVGPWQFLVEVHELNSSLPIQTK